MTNHCNIIKACLYFNTFTTVGDILKNDFKTQQEVSKYNTAVNMPVSINIY